MNAEAQMCVVPVPAILLGVAGDSIGAVFFTCQFSRAAEERRGRNGEGERANERAVGTREGEGGREETLLRAFETTVFPILCHDGRKCGRARKSWWSGQTSYCDGDADTVARWQIQRSLTRARVQEHQENRQAGRQAWGGEQSYCNAPPFLPSILYSPSPPPFDSF